MPNAASLGNLLRDAFDAALAAVDLSRLVFDALGPPPTGHGPCQILAVGKAALAMAEGASARWGAHALRTLVVVPEGYAVASHPSWETLAASHPLPDQASVRAGERCLSWVADRRIAHTLALISGGASALVSAPLSSLDDKRALTQSMLHASIPIGEINTVRRHVSRLKGGGLLENAAGHVETWLVSDVIGNRLEDIGSGPTVVDPTTMRDARRVLERAGILYDGPMRETLKSAPASDALARVLVSPEHIAHRVAEQLRARGLHAEVANPIMGSVTEAALLHRDRIAQLGQGAAIVCAAEPTLDLPLGIHGSGGRSTHLAAVMAPTLPDGVVFFAGATDGVDGMSRSAGAVVDRSGVDRVGATLWRERVAAFDTGTLMRLAGCALPLHPTGLNMADVHIVARI